MVEIHIINLSPWHSLVGFPNRVDPMGLKSGGNRTEINTFLLLVCELGYCVVRLIIVSDIRLPA